MGACRLSQNSTRSKMGKNHRPRAAVGTKPASESKPTTTAALGTKNPPLHMGISSGEKVKKTTGPRLSWEPKFDPIKKREKTTALWLPWVPKLHLNQSQPQLQLSEPKIHLSTWAFHLVKN